MGVRLVNPFEREGDDSRLGGPGVERRLYRIEGEKAV